MQLESVELNGLVKGSWGPPLSTPYRYISVHYFYLTKVGITMEGIFKKHFQRCFWSKADTVCTDIHFVLDGIKPALLIDCLPPNPDKVNLFLQEVIERDQSNRDIRICLLKVHEDLLIINVSAFLHLIQSAWPPVLLDVYGRPKIVTEHRKEQIFQTITSFIKPVFRELNTSMKPSDASFSVPNLGRLRTCR